VFDVIQSKYQAKIVLSDTDSVYCVFDHLKTDTVALWDYCEMVAKNISDLFPKPMSLAFEEVIYWRLLTLTKKRYMSLKCDKFGTINPKVEKKGVLLSRRDNSNFVRTVYQDIILKIFNREDNTVIIQCLLDYNDYQRGYRALHTYDSVYIQLGDIVPPLYCFGYAIVLLLSLSVKLDVWVRDRHSFYSLDSQWSYIPFDYSITYIIYCRRKEC
jgi:hypothetical protein